MDGTIADLYGVENWLDHLINEDTTPYEIARPLATECELQRLEKLGYNLAIVSWCSKNGSKDYNRKVRKAKKEWLKKYYPNIKFSEIHIVKYGTKKSSVAKYKGAILVDDEIGNRNEWKGTAYEPSFLKV